MQNEPPWQASQLRCTLTASPWVVRQSGVWDVGRRAWQSEHEIPMGRYGEPEELADLAVFLASPRGGYITGTVIPVDGGLRRYQY